MSCLMSFDHPLCRICEDQFVQDQIASRLESFGAQCTVYRRCFLPPEETSELPRSILRACKVREAHQAMIQVHRRG